VEEPERIGRYEVIERVGRGGMGVLFRGRDPVLEREVAIKVMSGDFSSDDAARARFFREARAAARLQHRNIVTIYEFAEDHGTPYIAMEFLRGRSLASRLQNDPPLTLVQKLDVVTQLCTGLHYAHEQGIVHRDVKPGNIWLMEDGTVKLLDFGIAKVAASTVTHAGSVLGSAAYMAPEQVAGREIDGRADVFAAGVVLYELLARRKPFEGEAPTAVMMKIINDEPPPLRQFAPDIPAALVNAVNRALQKDPDRRFMHAGDFGAELRLIRLSLERTTETVAGRGAEMAQTMYVPASEGSHGGLLLDPAAGASLEGSSSVRGVRHQPSGRFATWVAVAALAVAAVLATIVMLQRSAVPLSTSPAMNATPAKPADPAHASHPSPTGADGLALVKLISEPDGATITIDGANTGKVTPADVALADVTGARVRLTKDGYKAALVHAAASDIREGVVHARLERSPAGVDVMVSGSYPFEVLQGRQVISRTATRHSFTVPEPTTLRLRASKYLLDMPLKAQSPSGRVNFVLPGPGRLTVRTRLETCNVWIGGRDFDVPPIPPLDLAPGTYKIELRCPDGKVESKTVAIESGAAVREVLP
jgi:eukaryotic-like serine/threonine-protein kinase